MRLRRGRIIKLLLTSTILLVLYKASTWQERSVSPHKGAKDDPRVLNGQHLDLRSFVNNKSIVFKDWNDKSMDRYEAAKKCTQKIDQQLLPDLENVFRQMGSADVWQWIKNRISQKWKLWTKALSAERTKNYLDKFHKKRILVIPGVLRGTTYADPKVIAAGGPLGELLQWADLIAALHLLGHNVTLESDSRAGAARLYELIPRRAQGCNQGYDLIYVDVLAMNEIPEPVRNAFRCRFRVVDVYGTHAKYNHPDLSAAQGIQVNNGGYRLHLKQFYTFYPQTPDNSFLGFVVSPTVEVNVSNKENIGLLYGKDTRYARGLTTYVNVLSKYMDVHYTMTDILQGPSVGNLIHNGVLPHEDYGHLLDRTKIFIGLAEPIEGTGVMEALSHGCVFLNPILKGKSKQNFQINKKPTGRLLTSQIPYLEQYIGEPHVYTVDIDNTIDVIKTVDDILQQKSFEPFIPAEFTLGGYLERLSSYIEHQDLCTRDRRRVWPPVHLLEVVMSEPDQSCERACQQQHKVCEPVYFTTINTPSWLVRLSLNCSVIVSGLDVLYPAIDVSYGNVCWLQQSSLAFSCAEGSPDYRRICPCRRYRKHQVALWD